MSHRPPAPAHPEELAAAAMSLERARTIVDRACTSKQGYGQRAAMAIAEDRRRCGEPMSAYRCPFWCGDWHVGHVPGLEAMYDLAAAVRVLAGNRPTATS